MNRHSYLLVAGLVASTLPAVAVAQASGQVPQTQQKQDSTKKGMKHDMPMMKDHTMAEMGGSWKEMNAFHALLAAAYHPTLKDSLQPLRHNAADLASAAAVWSKSTAPASCNNGETRSKLASVAKDARALAEQVNAKASDADLKKSISALHALFETLEERCGGHDTKEMKH